MFLFSFITLFSVAFLFSCNKDNSSPSSVTTIGARQAFGSDSIRSWVITDASGTPTSVGVTFKAYALAGLPTTDTMYMLMLPTKSGMMSSMMAAPFDHVEIDWAPNGDPSPSVYNVAHLDCHFFTVTNTYQMGMMGGPDSGSLASQYVPMDCHADGDVEADMGAHWVDSTAPEYHGMAFDHAYNYGFYHGNMTFIEAMCSKTFLDTKTNYTGVIKQPGAFKQSGYYPMNYTISYNATAKEYTYSLDNLKMH